MNDIVASLRPAIKEYALEWHIVGDESIVVHSYPGVLWQIFTNLVMNSLHHGFDKRMQGRIDIEVEAATDHVSICYRDNGKGIAADDLPLIFNPFFTTRRHAGNTGLGLNMIYNLVVQDLHGQIRCDSELGHGVAFRITLPYRHAASD